MLTKIVKYSSAILTSNVITSALSFVATMLIAKYLSKEDFGFFCHYVLVYSTVQSFFMAGTQQSSITFINLDEDNYIAYIQLLFTFFAVFSIIMFGVAGISCFFTSRSTSIALFTVVPSLFCMLSISLFRAKMDFKYELGFKILISSINSIGTIAFIILIRSKYVPIIADLLSVLIPSLLLLSILYRKLLENSYVSIFVNIFNKKYAKFWHDTRYLWVAGICFIINSSITQLLTDAYLGIEALAMFFFVMTIWELIHRPISIVQQTILPVFTLEQQINIKQLYDIARSSLVVLPLICQLVLLVVPRIVEIYYADKYAGFRQYLSLLSLSVPILSVEFIYAGLFIAKGYVKRNRNIMLISMIINVPLIFAMLYKYGIFGAFLGKALSMIVSGGVALFYALIYEKSFGFRMVMNIVCVSIAHLISVFMIYYYQNIIAVLGIVMYLFITNTAKLWSFSELNVSVKKFSRSINWTISR